MISVRKLRNLLDVVYAELDTYCEIVPYNKFPKEDTTIKGVILSGSPFSVYDKDAFKVDLSEIRGKYPILGICYGAQFMSYTNGGKVEPAGTREYGRAHLTSFCKDNVLFKGVRENTQVWMSHGDTITAIPANFKKIASTDKVDIAAYQIEGENVWGVQFHPEVFHSEWNTDLEEFRESGFVGASRIGHRLLLSKAQLLN